MRQVLAENRPSFTGGAKSVPGRSRVAPRRLSGGATDRSGPGASAAAAARTVAQDAGAQVGGSPAETADFIAAVYGNAWWVVLVIVAITFLLLARALRSVVLPLKALLLKAISLNDAYGVTVLIWQRGVGTGVLFGQQAFGALTVWMPIAVFAFLFGLSMDYEVFLLSRIREKYDRGHDTDRATVHGMARTGRALVAALGPANWWRPGRRA